LHNAGRLARALHDAEEIAVGIGQDGEICTGAITPGIARRAERQQSLNLECRVIGIEIEVYPIAARPSLLARLQRDVRSLMLGVTEHHPSIVRRLARLVAESQLPEPDHSFELVAMDDDRANSQHG